jgi:hypothetical protein
MYANKNNGSYVGPPRGTRDVKEKHPSQGGNPYLVEFRQIFITMWQNDEDMRATQLMYYVTRGNSPLSPCASNGFINIKQKGMFSQSRLWAACSQHMRFTGKTL